VGWEKFKALFVEFGKIILANVSCADVHMQISLKTSNLIGCQETGGKLVLSNYSKTQKLLYSTSFYF